MCQFYGPVNHSGACGHVQQWTSSSATDEQPQEVRRGAWGFGVWLRHLDPLCWPTDFFCARTALRQLVERFDVTVFSMHDRSKTSENAMSACNPPRVSLPKSWNKRVRAGLLHVIALAQYAIVYTRGAAITSRSSQVRLRAENRRLRQQPALLAEELRIKDARLSRIPAHRLRP